MIANYQRNGWEVITQHAHGLLAAQLAAHWRTKDRPTRWIEFLIAVADHDDAQTELQRDDLLTPQGSPLDVKMRTFDLDHARRTLEFAGSKSRYIALLCSQHLHFIAGERSGQSKAVRQFLDLQKKQRTIWRKHLHISEEAAAQDYRLLEWCDALSLLICQQDQQSASQAVEISDGPDELPYQMRQLEKGVLTIEPWPFEIPQFEVCLESRVLQQLKFSSASQFKKVFSKAVAKEKNWILKKAGK